ncbi:MULTISPECIES: chaplin [unclassified Streptomyces]|uniref:chaplin n=1 Tax=unclassified Streptomyces TaxID=2593676 RepID=UPI002E28A6E8|nr:chaplin [Streptomyces sp. NBC_00223]
MKRVARKGLVTAMVAGGVLASAGYAQADSAADGEAAGSPGVLSGNSVQVPVHIPVNVCGNTIDVVGLLNPSFGNRCANISTGQSTFSGNHRPGKHAGRPAVESAGALSGGRNGGGAHAAGRASGSPGVASGNLLQLPLDIPANVTGNSANVVGILNPTFGNTSVNTDTPAPTPPVAPTPPAHKPVPAPPNPAPVTPSTGPTLAHTGSDGLGWTAAGSAALLLAGAALYRRSRPGHR